MLYVVGTIAVVIILITIVVTYSQMQVAKEQELKLKALNESARQLQSQFREEANKLTQDGLVSAQVKQKYASLGSNYFVFQSINDANVSQLKSVTELFTGLIRAIKSKPVGDELIHLIESGAKRIPYEARDFSSSFYATTVPKLISDLTATIEAIEIEEIAEEFEEVITDEVTSEHETEEQQRMEA